MGGTISGCYDDMLLCWSYFFFFQAEDGIRDYDVTGVQTCALPICRDADVYPEFGRAMGQLARFAKPIIDEEAPLPDSVDPRELMKLLGLSRRFRALGDDLATLQYKLTIMSAVDFLREWFECDELIAPMSCSGIIGTMLGVKSQIGRAHV